MIRSEGGKYDTICGRQDGLIHESNRAEFSLKNRSSSESAVSGGLSYRDAGVDIDAGNAVVEQIKPAIRSTSRPGAVGGIGGFGALFDLKKEGWRDPLLVSGTDGVGTKLMLARAANHHETIGIDLVAMCVNDILTSGAEPLFFLDYLATGKLEPALAQSVIEGIAEGCRQAGCALVGGETAEMPGMYGSGDYDLAGFTVGAVEREQLLDGSRIRAGHRLIGMASSGVHSNGYSLVRKVVERSGAALDAPFPDESLQGRTLGEVLLEPTRIYVKPLLPLLKAGLIDGLSHVTGGGLSENIIRMLGENLGVRIQADAWQRPVVFDWLQREGGISESEMRRTFNCGIGMVAAVEAGQAPEILDQLAEMGVESLDIGEVINAQDTNRVQFV